MQKEEKSAENENSIENCQSQKKKKRVVAENQSHNDPVVAVGDAIALHLRWIDWIEEYEGRSFNFDCNLMMKKKVEVRTFLLWWREKSE